MLQLQLQFTAVRSYRILCVCVCVLRTTRSTHVCTCTCTSTSMNSYKYICQCVCVCVCVCVCAVALVLWSWCSGHFALHFNCISTSCFLASLDRVFGLRSSISCFRSFHTDSANIACAGSVKCTPSTDSTIGGGVVPTLMKP